MKKELKVSNKKNEKYKNIKINLKKLKLK